MVNKAQYLLLVSQHSLLAPPKLTICSSTDIPNRVPTTFQESIHHDMKSQLWQSQSKNNHPRYIPTTYVPGVCINIYPTTSNCDVICIPIYHCYQHKCTSPHYIYCGWYVRQYSHRYIQLPQRRELPTYRLLGYVPYTTNIGTPSPVALSFSGSSMENQKCNSKNHINWSAPLWPCGQRYIISNSESTVEIESWIISNICEKLFFPKWREETMTRIANNFSIPRYIYVTIGSN